MGLGVVSLSGVGAMPQQNLLLLTNNVQLSLLKLKLVLVPEELFLVVQVKVPLFLLQLELLLKSEEFSVIVVEILLIESFMGGGTVNGVVTVSTGLVNSGKGLRGNWMASEDAFDFCKTVHE